MKKYNQHSDPYGILPSSASRKVDVSKLPFWRQGWFGAICFFPFFAVFYVLCVAFVPACMWLFSRGVNALLDWCHHQ
jgi:hypothetical protein